MGQMGLMIDNLGCGGSVISSMPSVQRVAGLNPNIACHVGTLDKVLKVLHSHLPVALWCVNLDTVSTLSSSGFEEALWQGSSITFSRGPKAQKIGKVAGHRLKSQLINRIYSLT